MYRKYIGNILECIGVYWEYIGICWKYIRIHCDILEIYWKLLLERESLAGLWQSATAKQIAPQIPVNLSPNPCHLIGKITNYSIVRKKIDYLKFFFYDIIPTFSDFRFLDCFYCQDSYLCRPGSG